MNRPGVLITFEGIDGCGKSTQARLLLELLRQEDFPVTFLRDPGWTSASQELTKIILGRGSDRSSFRAELLLCLAARAEMVAKVIVPAIKVGMVVIADRFHDSTYAYHIFGRLLPARAVRVANIFATDDLKPDLTFLVDLPVRMAEKRLLQQEDRVPAEGIYFCQRVRDGFLKLAQAEPNRIKLLDGKKSVEEVFSSVTKASRKLLRRRGVGP